MLSQTSTPAEGLGQDPFSPQAPNSSVLKAKPNCLVIPRQNMHQNQLGNFEVTSSHTSGNVNQQIAGNQVWEIRKVLLIILNFTKSLWFQPTPGENVGIVNCYMQVHVLTPD